VSKEAKVTWRGGAGAGSQAARATSGHVPTGAPAADGPRPLCHQSAAATRSKVTAGPRAGVRGAGLSCPPAMGSTDPGASFPPAGAPSPRSLLSLCSAPPFLSLFPF
jgi:hypothetical protein